MYFITSFKVRVGVVTYATKAVYAVRIDENNTKDSTKQQINVSLLTKLSFVFPGLGFQSNFGALTGARCSWNIDARRGGSKLLY